MDEENEVAQAATELKKHVETNIKNVETKLSGEIADLKKEAITKEELKKVSDEVIKNTEALKAMNEKGAKIISLKESLAKQISEKAEDIKKIFAQKNGIIEIKVAGTVTTGSVTAPNGTPDIAGSQFSQTPTVDIRESDIEKLVTRFATGLAAFPYTEFLPKDGDFSFIGEGASKPEIDFKLETRWAQPKKVAAYISLTEEAVTDVAYMQSLAYDFLNKKHALKKANGILFGDGTGDNLKGVTEYAQPFVAGDLANSVIKPNFMDTVNACVTKIYTTPVFADQMPHKANLVLVNPIDYFVNLVAAKDGQGLSLYPNASLVNQVTIGGITIMPELSIPVGFVLVADMSKYNITDYVGYNVKIGWINDDFIKNQFVILAESRLHGFVKELDKYAFIYDEIDTIKTAITDAI